AALVNKYHVRSQADKRVAYGDKRCVVRDAPQRDHDGPKAKALVRDCKSAIRASEIWPFNCGHGVASTNTGSGLFASNQMPSSWADTLRARVCAARASALLHASNDRAPTTTTRRACRGRGLLVVSHSGDPSLEIATGRTVRPA